MESSTDDDDMLDIEIKVAQAELARAAAEAQYLRLLAEQQQRKRQQSLASQQRSSSIQSIHNPATAAVPPIPSPPPSPSLLGPSAGGAVRPLPSPPLLLPAVSRAAALRVAPSAPVPLFSSSANATQIRQNGAKRRRADKPIAPDQRSLTPSSSDSTLSHSNSRVDDNAPASRKRRESRGKKLSGQIGVKVKVRVKQRREWLQSACGDKNTPVSHRLLMPPPFYHPDLDELSSSDPAVLQPVAAAWQSHQPSLVGWLTEVLKYRHLHTGGTAGATTRRASPTGSRSTRRRWLAAGAASTP
jgi:hypothetical protein